MLSKASARTLKTDLNLALVTMLSVLPDVDILLERIDGLSSLVPHRGPMHSVVAALLFFAPLIIVYRKKAIPYLVALVQHSLIGDYVTGGQLQLLWPLTQKEFGIEASISSMENVVVECLLFAVSIAVLVLTRDLFTFFKPHRSSLILLIPVFTVLLPTFVGYPLTVPFLLIIPHLFYLVLFLIAVFAEIGSRYKGQTNSVRQL